jgi:hypothetical protein
LSERDLRVAHCICGSGVGRNLRQEQRSEEKMDINVETNASHKRTFLDFLDPDVCILPFSSSSTSCLILNLSVGFL